jgi:hypothetical protein
MLGIQYHLHIVKRILSTFSRQTYDEVIPLGALLVNAMGNNKQLYANYKVPSMLFIARAVLA